MISNDIANGIGTLVFQVYDINFASNIFLIQFLLASELNQFFANL